MPCAHALYHLVITIALQAVFRFKRLDQDKQLVKPEAGFEPRLVYHQCVLRDDWLQSPVPLPGSFLVPTIFPNKIYLFLETSGYKGKRFSQATILRAKKAISKKKKKKG